MTSHATSPIIDTGPKIGEGIVVNAYRPQGMRRILGVVVLVLILAGVFAAISIDAVAHHPLVIADQTIDTISAHMQFESMHPSSG